MKLQFSSRPFSNGPLTESSLVRALAVLVVLVLFLLPETGALAGTTNDEGRPPGVGTALQRPRQPLSGAAPGAPNNLYATYTYTHSDLILFSYHDGTYLEVYDSGGVLRWSGTLDSGEHQELISGVGVFQITSTAPFSVLTGDAATLWVIGYYALDDSGKAVSTRFHTYQVDWSPSSVYPAHFIVFAYQDNTTVTLTDSDTGAVIWSGTLDAGEHYDNTTIDDQYVTVEADRPVSALSFTDQGYYVPAANGLFTGQLFYTYASFAHAYYDFNVLAYHDNTTVTVSDSETGIVHWSGTLDAGERYTKSTGDPDEFLKVVADRNVVVSASPVDNNYYHSLYVPDAQGSGIGNLFYHPANAGGQLVVFSYEDDTDVTITDAQTGTLLWQGTLDSGAYHALTTSQRTYRVSGNGRLSLLYDWGDIAGADFAPVYYGAASVLSQGSLSLMAGETYPAGSPVSYRIGVHNPTVNPAPYEVQQALVRESDSVVVASRTDSLTVNAGEQVVTPVAFTGVSQGSYRLEARLYTAGGVNLLHSQTAGLSVYDAATAHLIGEYAEELRAAARGEFDQMGLYPARSLLDLLTEYSVEKVFGWITDKALEIIAPITEAGALPPITNNDALHNIQWQLAQWRGQKEGLSLAIRQFFRTYGVHLPATYDPLSEPLSDVVDETLLRRVKDDLTTKVAVYARNLVIKPAFTNPEMRSVDRRHQAFGQAMAGLTFSDIYQMEGIFFRGRTRIMDISESESLVTIGPYEAFGYTFRYDFTLAEQEAKLQTAKTASKWIKYGLMAAAFAAVAIMALLLAGAIVGTGGLAAAVVPVMGKILVVLLKAYKLAKIAKFIIMGLFVLLMTMSVQKLAPMVTGVHDETLDQVEGLANLTAEPLSLEQFSINVASASSTAEIRSVVANPAPVAAEFVVETAVYSADGRLVELGWSRNRLEGGAEARLDATLELSPGDYRAVTTLHNGAQVAAESLTSEFTVEALPLDLNLDLSSHQYAVGETVQAIATVSNLSTSESAEDLVLLVQVDDGEHAEVFEVSVPADGQEQFSFPFVPGAAGAYTVRASLLAASRPVAVENEALVVGAGPAVAVNYEAGDLYPASEHETVQVPFTLSNVGTSTAQPLLELVTFDKSSDMTRVYSETHTLSLTAAATVNNAYPVLADVQPGLYVTHLYLDGLFYDSFDFVVGAEDTLFAGITAPDIHYGVNETVTLEARVTNSAYAPQDVEDMEVMVTMPDGAEQQLATTRDQVGSYLVDFTPPISGTYLASTAASADDYRVLDDQTYFVVDQPSPLLPTVDGELVARQRTAYTVTVTSEYDTPVIGATVVLSGTEEYLETATDSEGQALFFPAPHEDDELYHLRVSKMGYLAAQMDVPVAVALDTTPPYIFLHSPLEGQIVNTDLLTVAGQVEPGSTISVNQSVVAVNAAGFFTDTQLLDEGANSVVAHAMDSAGNQRTLTRSVVLDTVPPLLDVTAPSEGAEVDVPQVSVEGTTEAGATVLINNVPAAVAADGSFARAIGLREGTNTVVVRVLDEAGNEVQEEMLVTYVPPVGPVFLPLIVR